MVIISVKELVQKIHKLIFSLAETAGKDGMKICNLKLDGRNVLGNLIEDFKTVIILFEASVYQGIGEETWKGVLCRRALENALPNTNSIWSTSLRRSEN